MQEILDNDAIEAPKRNDPQALTISLPTPSNPAPNPSRLGPNLSQLTPHVPQDKSKLANYIPSGMFSGAFIGVMSK